MDRARAISSGDLAESTRRVRVRCSPMAPEREEEGLLCGGGRRRRRTTTAAAAAAAAAAEERRRRWARGIVVNNSNRVERTLLDIYIYISLL